MRLRKVDSKLLIKSAIVYRLLTVGLEFLFLFVMFGELKKAGITAVIWNVFNIGWYYVYHHWFARRYKVGL